MNLRLLAAKVLTRVVVDGQSLTVALEQVLQTVESPQDRALVQALCYGVCRQYHRLDFILSQLLDRPLKDIHIRLLILVGLYQLGFMRIKTHAAVSETVNAAGRKPWAKGLINALLRRYLREREPFEKAADENASASCSHPEWLIAKIRQDWPDEADRCLRENNQPPPFALRVNLARISREAYRELLNAQGLAAELPGFCASALILDQPVPVERLPGFAEGLVSVQDTAAQLAAGLLDVQPGQRVLDLCAAPGGKTAHILEMQPQLKEMVAIDVDANRLRRVEDNLRRLRLEAKTVAGDASHPEDWWDGRQFDRILVDAPCSALGVIRRHPDIKLLRRAGDIEPLAALQRAILDAAWSLLAPGGCLLYATCSVLKEENERRIVDFLAGHPDAIEWPITAEWGAARAAGRQILPGDLAMDGFYYARLRKA
ncbi:MULTISPECIES: 16S rRNA (cytosine(967)-C(5))-methyltransferase RsmB [Methylomicrobium]|uniref:16S rRNA (cytosine(967)-C(5))-methyltransferase n=1 Tax=Methylomicrobium album BG8 TaxID=686340 RepID=H8GLE1_METAL|nr:MULTISPECIES: 16S rRNA (cytosine(967)-C(5))-methyltransferase RsmB [Methylomicrobium]EIC28140.1 ribosomal RNA small subunit methyltransferase RsmB [Methylomicrobium album BG8]